MKPLKKTSIFLFLLFLLGGTSACNEDGKELPENEYPIPLNWDDQRYADQETIFTLEEQEGYLQINKDNICIICPYCSSGGFQETLLPIRLPSKEIIIQALGWLEIYEDLSNVSVIYSGDVKAKEGSFYPIVLTNIRAFTLIPFPGKP